MFVGMLTMGHENPMWVHLASLKHVSNLLHSQSFKKLEFQESGNFSDYYFQSCEHAYAIHLPFLKIPTVWELSMLCLINISQTTDLSINIFCSKQDKAG